MKRRVLIVIAVLLVAGAFGNYLRYIEQLPDRPVTFDSIPLEANGYFGEEHRFAEVSYDILQADTTTLRRYIGSNGTGFWLFVAYFASQKYGSQVHSPKHCLPGGGWKIRFIEPYDLTLPGGRVVEVNRLVIGDQTKRQLMLYWYETQGGIIRNEFGLKFDLMKNSLLLRPTDAAIIRLTTSIAAGDDLDAATAEAVAFFDAFYPSIERALPFDDGS